MTPHTECGDERSSEATASSHAQRLERKEKEEHSQLQAEEHTQPQGGGRAQLSARRRRQAQWYVRLPRAETAPVAMRLSDTRQSRDECLHGRTQLWASATRSSCHRRTHVSLNVTTGHITRTTPSTTTLEKDSSSRSQVDHRAHG